MLCDIVNIRIPQKESFHWYLNFATSLTTVSPLEFRHLSISSSMTVSAFLQQSKLIEIEPKLNSVSKGTVLSNSSIMLTFWLLDVCDCHHQRSQSEMESSHVLLLPPHLPHPHLLPSLLDVSSYIEPDEFSTIWTKPRTTHTFHTKRRDKRT